MRLNKNGTTDIIPVMNYSQAFGHAPPDQPFNLLRRYPTDIILLRVAKINAIIYLQEHVVIQNMRVLKEAIFEGLPESTEVTVQLSALLGQSKSAAFSGPVMSLIIKEALENYLPAGNGGTGNAIMFAGDLFKAILAYNEHFYEDREEWNFETFAGLFKLDMQQQYYLRREKFLKLNTLLKFAFLSKFLSDDEKLRVPALEYCRALQIGTVWGLAQFFLNILTGVLGNGKEAKYILERNGEQWPVLEQFILRKEDLIRERKLSLHKEVVPKPYYELDQHRLLILDNNYFTFGLDQGVMYSFFNKTSISNKMTFNEYQSYFGLKYFERYFVGRFIKTIFSKWNNYVVGTEKYQDYIVKAGQNVFVFEVKMNNFNANGLDNSSFSDFKKFIDEKFLAPKKGFQQIVRQISYLAEDKVLQQSLNITNPQKISVYPIIVYSDINLDMNGVNEYVNETVPEHLAKFTGQFQNIRPLIMINGDFFMTYYHFLRKDPATFAQWLNDYLKSVGNHKKQYQKSKDPHAFMFYNRSFAGHMRRKILDGDKDFNLLAIAADFDVEIRNFGEDVT